MVHFRLQVARQTVGPFREDGEVGFLGIGDEVLADPSQGLVPELEVDRLLSGSLKILFDQILCF